MFLALSFLVCASCGSSENLVLEVDSEMGKTWLVFGLRLYSERVSIGYLLPGCLTKG